MSAPREDAPRGARCHPGTRPRSPPRAVQCTRCGPSRQPWDVRCGKRGRPGFAAPSAASLAIARRGLRGLGATDHLGELPLLCGSARRPDVAARQVARAEFAAGERLELGRTDARRGPQGRFHPDLGRAQDARSGLALANRSGERRGRLLDLLLTHLRERLQRVPRHRRQRTCTGPQAPGPARRGAREAQKGRCFLDCIGPA